jgi:hypothetical protein
MMQFITCAVRALHASGAGRSAVFGLRGQGAERPHGWKVLRRKAQLRCSVSLRIAFWRVVRKLFLRLLPASIHSVPYSLVVLVWVPSRHTRRLRPALASSEERECGESDTKLSAKSRHARETVPGFVASARCVWDIAMQSRVRVRSLHFDPRRSRPPRKELQPGCSEPQTQYLSISPKRPRKAAGIPRYAKARFARRRVFGQGFATEFGSALLQNRVAAADLVDKASIDGGTEADRISTMPPCMRSSLHSMGLKHGTCTQLG